MTQPESVLLEQARRQLSRQEANLDSLRIRAAGLLSAAGLVTGLLAGNVPQHGNIPLSVVAIVAFSLMGALMILVTLPREWNFAAGMQSALNDIEDCPEDKRQALGSAIELSLARQLTTFHDSNKEWINQRIRWFYWGCWLLLIEVVAWTAVHLLA